ncbi:3771e6d2-6473-47fe-9897-ec38197fabb8 [Sclerotinia trifoliorum]|uniref:ATP-dependent RNA helicase SUV3, mitochondrial n=1 Tax=Sclerotinia trifoliorum TaxID=28548 RepID=A0A8H2ZRD5_9HELO|nr:3771e6d2-6473-47fe-9897-ec38197fabb8 [Sclerotinia trifoliorum]
MTLVNRRFEKCAFCTFRSLIWLNSSLLRPNGRSFHQSSPVARGVRKGRKKRPEHPPRNSYGVGYGPPRDTQGRARTEFRKFEDNIVAEAQGLKKKFLHGTKLRNAIKDEDLAGLGVSSREEFVAKLQEFEKEAAAAGRRATELGEIDRSSNPLFCKFKDAYIARGVKGLEDELRHSFTNFTLSGKFSKEELANHQRLADFRYPIEWFPATRAMQRTFHLHVGPTNSGKTYHALQKLEAANSGIYAGPLRLLAHEVYTRLNANGKPCSLITGEERRIPDCGKDLMKSCTVEMVPLNTKVDIAVIDEIQMIGDEDRGWAWTQAVLGVQAEEVHLCGELRTTELIKKLCAMMGDKLVIHNYERLGKLQVMSKSLSTRAHERDGPSEKSGGPVSKLEKGDAIILFSRMKIHAMKNQIEAQHKGKRCAIVYGSLPPETRALQAALFNDPDNDYDFLVASNAIGMGLNLSVKRVILESVSRFDGTDLITLPLSEIKQIAGRAGRYKTARDAIKAGPIDLTDGIPAKPTEPPVGLVTTFYKEDHKILSNAMSKDAAQMSSAGIFPPADVIERFAERFPKSTPFSYIILRLHEIGSISSQFHLCKLKDHVDIADIIQEFNLSTRNRLVFIAAPVPIRDSGVVEVLRTFARCVADNTGGHVLDISELDIGILDEDPDTFTSQQQREIYVRKVEGLHKNITLYLWLSYRFTGVFHSQALAFHIKRLVEEKIDLCLAKAEWQEKARVSAMRRNIKLLKALDPTMVSEDKSLRDAVSNDTPLQEDVSEDVEISSKSETLLEGALDDVESSSGAKEDRGLI